MSQTKISQAFNGKIAPVNNQKSAIKNYFFVRQNKNMLVKIFHDEISHIKSNKDYCLIFTSADVFCIHYSLEKMISNLPSDKFFRCHRKYIVNLDRIKTIKNNICCIDQYDIQISKNRHNELLGKINYIPATYRKKK